MWHIISGRSSFFFLFFPSFLFDCNWENISIPFRFLRPRHPHALARNTYAPRSVSHVRSTIERSRTCREMTASTAAATTASAAAASTSAVASARIERGRQTWTRRGWRCRRISRFWRWDVTWRWSRRRQGQSAQRRRRERSRIGRAGRTVRNATTRANSGITTRRIWRTGTKTTQTAGYPAAFVTGITIRIHFGNPNFFFSFSSFLFLFPPHSADKVNFSLWCRCYGFLTNLSSSFFFFFFFSSR